VGRVVEEEIPAEVSDDGVTGVHADTRHAQCNALGVLFLSKRFRELVNLHCARYAASRVVHLFLGCAEYRVHGIADDLLRGAAMAEDDLGHVIQVFIQQRHHHHRIQAFDQRCEFGEIREYEGEIPPLSAKLEKFRILGELIREVGREIAGEIRLRLLGGLA